MQPSLRILEKIPARFCRKFLCSTAYIENNAENNASVPVTTNNPRRVTITHQTFDNFVNLFKEVTKNRSENNVDVIIEEAMKNIRENQLHVSKECAAEILENEECRYMLNVLNNNMSALSTTQVINVLLLLKNLNVPQHTMIVQNTLAILRSKMNDLYIKEIVPVIKLLYNYNDTPLAKALLSALVKIFKLKIRTEMDITDIKELVYVFQHASLFDLSRSTAQLTEILLEKIPQITSEDALKIHFTLCRMPIFSPAQTTLYRKVNRILLTENGLLKNAHILEILQSIKRGINLGNEAVYKPIFVNEFCYHMVNRKPPINDLLSLIKLMHQLRHISKHLLKYMDQLWKDNLVKQLNSISRAESIFCCLKYFGDANHNPGYWNNIEWIIKRDLLPNCTDSELLYCTLNLLALDCFIPQLVERVLKMETKYSFDDFVQLEVYQMVKVLHPELSLEPAPHTLKKIREFCESELYIEEANKKFLSLLEKCLGGAEYVKSGLKTELGHKIDHILLLSEFGNFMPFDDDTGVETAKFVKDLKIPTNRRLVLVQTLPNDAYLANVNGIRSVFRVKTQSLQKLTHCPVLTINMTSVDYLSREVLEMLIQKAVTEKGDYEFVTHYDGRKMLSDGGNEAGNGKTSHDDLFV